MRDGEKKRRRRRAGMTLVEVMAVLIIMAIIASAIGISVMKAMSDANKRATATDARAIQGAATQYVLENPRDGCPDVHDLMENGTLDPTRDNTDAWGNEFLIECDANAIHVKSAGEDGQFGTDDDIGF